MRYLMLIHENPSGWQHPTFAHRDETEPTEIATMQREFDAVLAELVESGEFVSGYPLADPALTRSVRVRDGRTLVSDGPRADAKEQLAGYFVVDCESWERVEEIAVRFPSARFGAVEIRPVMVHSGSEM